MSEFASSSNGARRNEKPPTGEYKTMLWFVLLLVAFFAGSVAFRFAAVAALRELSLSIALEQPGFTSQLAGYHYVIVVLAFLLPLRQRLHALVAPPVRPSVSVPRWYHLHRNGHMNWGLVAALIFIPVLDFGNYFDDARKAFAYFGWGAATTPAAVAATAAYLMVAALLAYLLFRPLSIKQHKRQETGS